MVFILPYAISYVYIFYISYISYSSVMMCDMDRYF